MGKAVYYYLPLLRQSSYRDFLEEGRFSTYVIGDEFCPRRFLALVPELKSLVLREPSRRYVLATPPVYPLEFRSLIQEIRGLVASGNIREVIVNDLGVLRTLLALPEIRFYLGRFVNRHRYGAILPLCPLEGDAADYLKGKVPASLLRHPRVVGSIWESADVEDLAFEKDVVVCHGPTRLALTRSCPLGGNPSSTTAAETTAPYNCSKRCLDEVIDLSKSGDKLYWWGVALLAADVAAASRPASRPVSELHFCLPDELAGARVTPVQEDDDRIRRLVERPQGKQASGTPPVDRGESSGGSMDLVEGEVSRLDLGSPYNSVGVSNIDVFRRLDDYLSLGSRPSDLVAEIFLGLKFEDEELRLLRYPHRRNTACTSFSGDEFRYCIERCRALGLNVAVTFNEIYPRGRFENRILNLIGRSVDMGATSLIVSDLDLLAEARIRWPQLYLTAGVGAGAFNADSARLLAQLGANRVVFTRKLYGTEMFDVYRDLASEAVDLEFFSEPLIGCLHHDACCYLHNWGAADSWPVREGLIACGPLWTIPGTARPMCRLCSAYYARLIQTIENRQRPQPSRKLTWKFSLRERFNRTKDDRQWFQEMLERITAYWHAPNICETYGALYGTKVSCDGCPDHPERLLACLRELGPGGQPSGAEVAGKMGQ